MGMISRDFLKHVCPKNGPKIPVNIYCNNGYTYQNVLIKKFGFFSIQLFKPEDPDFYACVFRLGMCAIHTYRAEVVRKVNYPTTVVSQETADMLG